MQQRLNPFANTLDVILTTTTTPTLPHAVLMDECAVQLSRFPTFLPGQLPRILFLHIHVTSMVFISLPFISQTTIVLIGEIGSLRDTPYVKLTMGNKQSTHRRPGLVHSASVCIILSPSPHRLGIIDQNGSYVQRASNATQSLRHHMRPSANKQ